MKNTNCVSCVYARAAKDERGNVTQQLLCFRHPPVPALIPTQHPMNPQQMILQSMMQRPAVMPTDFCGDHLTGNIANDSDEKIPGENPQGNLILNGGN